MAQWWWRGDGWQEICFKRVPEGWIFRAPNPWILGLHRHYLVRENQRTEIIAFYSQVNWHFVIVVGVFAVFFTAVLALALSLVPSQTAFLVIIVFSFLVGYLINAYFWLALRPLLAGAPRTAERITLSELLRARAAMLSLPQLIFFTLLFAVSCAFLAYQAFTSAWGIYPTVDSLTATAVSGWAAFYSLWAAFHFFAMLRAKGKMTSGPWS
jgi:hypothetical protein